MDFDQLLNAIDYEEFFLIVIVTDVASSQPSVRTYGIGRGFGVVVVTHHHLFTNHVCLSLYQLYDYQINNSRLWYCHVCCYLSPVARWPEFLRPRPDRIQLCRPWDRRLWPLCLIWVDLRSSNRPTRNFWTRTRLATILSFRTLSMCINNFSDEYFLTDWNLYFMRIKQHILQLIIWSKR